MPFTHDFYLLLRQKRREISDATAAESAARQWAMQLNIAEFRERKPHEKRFKKQHTKAVLDYF